MDQAVDFPRSLDGVFNRLAARILIRKFGGYAKDLFRRRSHLLHEPLGIFRIAVGDGNDCPFFRKGTNDGGSDAFGSAGDEGDLPGDQDSSGNHLWVEDPS